MNPLRKLFERTLGRFLSRLRFPQLFVLTALVFLVDLAVPDMIPFVDEILLALGSLILGSLKERSSRGDQQLTGREDSGNGDTDGEDSAGRYLEGGGSDGGAGRDAPTRRIEEEGPEDGPS